MSIGTEIVERTRKTIQDKLEQIEYFQDQIVIVDDQKSLYDQAIFRLDNNILGEIQIVNRALDDVKDAYSVRFSGVNSCRSDLIWMATNWNKAPTPNQLTFQAVALNENGYTGIMAQIAKDNPGGNVVGLGSTFFYYIDPSSGILTTSPTNAVSGAEQGTTDSFEHDGDTFRF